MKWETVKGSGYRWTWLKDFPFFDSVITYHEHDEIKYRHFADNGKYTYKNAKFNKLKDAQAYVELKLYKSCCKDPDGKLSRAIVSTWCNNVGDGKYSSVYKNYIWIFGAYLPWCHSSNDYALRYPASVGVDRLSRICTVLTKRHRERFIREYKTKVLAEFKT